jgi:hypothetical protein
LWTMKEKSQVKTGVDKQTIAIICAATADTDTDEDMT